MGITKTIKRVKPKTLAASVLSGLAVSAALAHAFFPAIVVDTVTVYLLAIAVLPWLGLFFRSIELPGGMKVEYQDLKEVEDKARDAGLISNFAEGTKPSDAVYERIATEDPNLALAGLRIDVERELVALAARHGITASKVSPNVIARELTKMQILPRGAQSALSDLLPLLSKAVHGAKVEQKSVEWALTTGSQIIAALRAK